MLHEGLVLDNVLWIFVILNPTFCIGGCVQAPKVIACTHLSEVLHENVLPRNAQLAFQTMSVLAESTADHDGASAIVFLYKCVLHPACSSHSAPSSNRVIL